MSNPIKSQFISVLAMIPSLFVFYTAFPQSSKITAEEIIDKCIETHGHEKFKEIHLEFTFRDYDYMLHRDKLQTIYSRKTKVDTLTITDVYPLKKRLKRKINGQEIELSDSLAQKFQTSLNSVMYFVELPNKLKDPTVITEYLGEKIINDDSYHVLKISFDPYSNDDHQDEYRYWINSKTFTMDYFAYSFQVDGGGTRFRKAINRREIKGVVFQDYENYRPIEKYVPLDTIPDLLIEGKLLMVSLIEKRNISLH